ncbi:pLS20_p028 family conjugation system transmembrane protein [Clostridium sardiniense]|uniref:pLS20_p028 family conjugation system transmembrane protein n=1 Tax=Clostridium sardiniense TaxID=29369 RepID=UPI001957CAB2|nr:hypothetical protein [Clostridium sardiniense]MBM7835610.1 hypothetical protein [Clostridium sardiniense]
MFGDDNVKSILNAYDNFFTKSDFFINCLRWLGWLIIRGLTYLVEGLENIVNSVTSVTEFFNSAGVKEIIDKFKPVLGLLLVFSIIFIGYQIMLNKKYDRSRIPMNVILALCVVVVLPIAMTKLNKITKLGMDEVKGNISMSKQIVSNNVTDLYLLDKSGFPIEDNKPKDMKVKNNLGNDILKITPNEEIDRGKVKNTKVFENEIFRDMNGGEELSRINGLFKWDDEYYRFNINFFTIICTLLITAGVLIFTAVKIVKLSIELAFNKIMTTFIAVGDLSGGQKLRQSINMIISIFVAIFSTTLMLKIYILATAYFTDRLSPIGSIIAMLASAIFVIDGPNYIEKIFGIDAGLSSVWRAVTGINSALDIMNKMGTVAGGAVDKMKDLGAGVLGGLAFGKGMAEGVRDSLEDEMDKENSSKENDDNKNEPLDNQMKKEGDTNNEDIESNDGDTSLDNDIDNPNSEEDLSDDNTTLDEDIENEKSEYGNENLNKNGDEDIENNQSTLEDDINGQNSNENIEDNNIDGNKELSDNENNIDESSNQSLEDDMSSNINSSFEDDSLGAFDDISGDSDYGVDDISNNDLVSGGDDIGENIGNEIPNTDELGTKNIEDTPLENMQAKNIQDETINSSIPNDSSKESIDSNNEIKSNCSNNPNIGYENPIEDRNIFEIAKDNLKGRAKGGLNDFGMKLDRNYTIGKNTGRDIKKFINKKDRRDK